MIQTTDTVMMVRPVRFEYIDDKALNDAFQKDGSIRFAQKEELDEFDNYVRMLRAEGIIVMEIEDEAKPFTPKSIFPDCWFSVHTKIERANQYKILKNDLIKSSQFINDLPDAEKYIVIYPLKCVEKREEKYKTPIKILKEHYDGKYYVIDLSSFEKEDKFLEGNDSLVFDRDNKVIYATNSEKTNEEVLEYLASYLDYKYFLFDATDQKGEVISKTNSILSIGKKFAFLCLEAIKDTKQKKAITTLLKDCGKEIIEISPEQVDNFSGNIIELHTMKDGIRQPVYVISAKAKASLKPEQIELISDYSIILSPEICGIEKNCGGSARDMLGEIF